MNCDSNFEILIEKALSNARMELECFNNNYNNKSLLIEINILQ
jgi:hypothetical protein